MLIFAGARGGALFASAVGLALAIAACSASNDDGNGGSGPGPATSGTGAGSVLPTASGGSGGAPGDPTTCAEAEATETYLGCEFWPTVVANSVWSIFDYAVVVANGQDAAVTIEVTRDGASVATATVGPNEAGKVFLPWVPELKGQDNTVCGQALPPSASVRVDGGAYRLVSSAPVTVYQFSALEYQGVGGPENKSWVDCPGNDVCSISGMPLGCYSFTNDASLLVPTNALTKNYRITSIQGSPSTEQGSYATVTGTASGTQVTVYTSATASVVAGNDVTAIGPGSSNTFLLGAGDVVQLLAPPEADLGGTLIQSTKPVQVIAGSSCTQVPDGSLGCDHIEETVFPAETLGKRYFVTVPTSPQGQPIGHVVRIFGNVDGTQLTYPGTKPAAAPDTIDAGDVVDLGLVTESFEVSGDQSFAVAGFSLSASLADPDAEVPEQMGDPDQSLMAAVEQFRDKYVFLAPDDYAVSYVDITMPMDATVTLDGAPIAGTPTLIGSNYGIARIELGAGNGGAHVLTADAGVGIQVMGYGAYTSYQYPGGLNLKAIAPPPEVPK